MSYLAISQRHAYIDRRLRYRADYPSAAQLAKDFGDEYGDDVHPETIKRDIEKLRMRGAPIEYDARRHGWYYADDTWQLPALDLTEGDLMALLVGERALEAYRNSPYHTELRSVFARLTELLPDKVSVQSEDLVEHVSVITDPITRIDSRVWETVRTGLFRQTSIAIHYQAPGYDTTATRIVDPLHLVGHRGEWYLLCWSHHHEAVRIYAMVRIKSAHLRDESFVRPDGFDPESYIDPAFGVFVNEASVQVAIQFDGEAAATIPERTWHRDQTIERLPDGGIVLRFRTNQQSQVLFWLSQWGPNAEILEPPELRERARVWSTGVANRYR